MIHEELNGGIVFMRVGTHAEEPLEQIVDRKLAEIDKTGHAFWGYGGRLCHPRSVVQPYADELAKEGGVVRLCMEEVAPDTETYWADSQAASEWSIDGLNFKPIPQGIRVTGSRYAFVVAGLRRVGLDLPLHRVKVAAGTSRGRSGAKYLGDAGQPVDKAVLEVDDRPGNEGEERSLRISLVAELQRPFAVFLR